VPDRASAFERLVLPHLDAAYNLARWLAPDAAAADDIVQEAMLRALRFHAGLRGEAKPWLLQIVRNVAYARGVSRRRAGEVALDDSGSGGAASQADPADDPEAALERRERCLALDQALAALPDELRECVVLRELEEMSYKEIAQITLVPIGTVMSRLFRARQLLMGGAR
jgi:RNA polymerase sigma-70 factor (ECF subfamily)